MNTKYNGATYQRLVNGPKGKFSAAAKAAFADIRKDKDMRVYFDTPFSEGMANIILTEDILCEVL